VVLRTLWRVKNSKVAPGLGGNKRPDFQELLTDVRFLVWVRMGADANAALPLVRRLASALDAPAEVKRFGGLSLGESTCLVDEVRQRRGADPARGRFLIRDEEGELSLPVWPDHVGSRGTRWDQFRLSEARALADGPPAECWVRVCRQEG
jgi:CRISPR-associated protein Cas5t